MVNTFSHNTEIIMNPHYDLIVSHFLKSRYQRWNPLGRALFREASKNAGPKNTLNDLSDMFLRILEHPQTQRMIFDSRQFELFQTYKDSVDPDVVQIMPFESMWFEFGKSIPFTEPGFTNLRLIGMYIGHTPNMNPVMQNLEQVVLFSKDYSPEAQTMHIVNKGSHVYGVKEESDQYGTYVFHTLSFMYNLSTGLAYCFKSTLEGYDHEFPDPSDVQLTPYSDVIKRQVFTDLMNYDDNDPWIGVGTHAGHIGAFERTVMGFSRTIGWMLGFMTAKSVQIVEADLPRPIRRKALREGTIPRPWHIIRVQPKLINSNGSESGITHSYRYDVASHVRMQRRRLPDGSYRKTVEIVRAHQRGLKHLLYIPATRKYKE